MGHYYQTYLEALEDTLALRGLEELLFLFLRRLITIGLEITRGAMKLFGWRINSKAREFFWMWYAVRL